MAPQNHAASFQLSKEEQNRVEDSVDEENSETGSGESEEESSSGEGQLSPKPYKLQTLVPNSDSKSKSISRVEDSDSETESEGPSVSAYKVEPAGKPSQSVAKRPGEEVSRSSKKLKIGEKEDKKTTLITRLWSDEDEIAVLKAIIDLKEAKGNHNNAEEMYNFVKGKLRGNFNKEQVRTKVNRLKKRYRNAFNKANGSDPVFSKPHEDFLFELSKNVWGDDAGRAPKTVNVKKVVAKSEIQEKDHAEDVDFLSKYPYLSSSFLDMKGNLPSLSISDDLFKEHMSLMGESKVKDLNNKWRQLFIEETELNHKKMILMAEQSKLVLNQLKDG